MADQLSSLYAASLVLALIGALVCVNALLAAGLRWGARRISAFWHGRSDRSHTPTRASDAAREPFDPASTIVGSGRRRADRAHGRFVPR
jgi:hypothetical protein